MGSYVKMGGVLQLVHNSLNKCAMVLAIENHAENGLMHQYQHYIQFSWRRKMFIFYLGLPHIEDHIL